MRRPCFEVRSTIRGHMHIRRHQNILTSSSFACASPQLGGPGFPARWATPVIFPIATGLRSAFTARKHVLRGRPRPVTAWIQLHGEVNRTRLGRHPSFGPPLWVANKWAPSGYAESTAPGLEKSRATGRIISVQHPSMGTSLPAARQTRRA